MTFMFAFGFPLSDKHRTIRHAHLCRDYNHLPHFHILSLTRNQRLLSGGNPTLFPQSCWQTKQATYWQISLSNRRFFSFNHLQTLQATNSTFFWRTYTLSYPILVIKSPLEYLSRTALVRFLIVNCPFHKMVFWSLPHTVVTCDTQCIVFQLISISCIHHH